MSRNATDIEDDNIWRLVAADPERRQHSYAHQTRLSRSNISGSSIAGVPRQINARELSHSERTRRITPIRVVACSIASLLTILSLIALLYSVKLQQHRFHHSASPESGFARSAPVNHSPQTLDLHTSKETNSAPVGLAPKVRNRPPVDSSLQIERLKPMPYEIDHSMFDISTQIYDSPNVLPVEHLHGFKSLWEKPETTDIPVFFNVGYQLTGGKVFKDILWMCHRLTISGDDSRTIIKEYPRDEVERVKVPNPHPSDLVQSSMLPVVNFDTTINGELRRAKRAGLAQSGLVDMIVIRQIFRANEIFDQEHRGRLFAVFRHPVHAALAAFHSLQYTNPQFKELDFESYIKSEEVDNNWMTRALNNLTMNEPLDHYHLINAVKVLNEKVLVGLTSKQNESLERFEQYFGWRYHEDPIQQESCRTNILLENVGAEENHDFGSNNIIPKGVPLEEGDHLYKMLLQKNRYDAVLYEKVVDLYEKQAELFERIQDNFRLLNATCCECDKNCPS